MVVGVGSYLISPPPPVSISRSLKLFIFRSEALETNLLARFYLYFATYCRLKTALKNYRIHQGKSVKFIVSSFIFQLISYARM